MYSLAPRDQHALGTDTWVLSLSRTPSGGLAAISSDQALSLYDPSSLSRGPAARLPTRHGNLTALDVLGDSVVCTAGEDGSVEVWDLRSRASALRFQGKSPRAEREEPPRQGRRRHTQCIESSICLRRPCRGPASLRSCWGPEAYYADEWCVCKCCIQRGILKDMRTNDYSSRMEPKDKQIQQGRSQRRGSRPRNRDESNNR